MLHLSFSSIGPGEEHAPRVQVSWGFWIMHHEDMLDDTPQIPSAGIHAQRQVQPRCSRGACARQAEQAPRLPEDQETTLLPQAQGHGASLHREVSQLLRG